MNWKKLCCAAMLSLPLFGDSVNNTGTSALSTSQQRATSHLLPGTEESLPSSEASGSHIAETKAQDVTWQNVAPRILRDQLRIWTFPAKLGKGQKPDASFGDSRRHIGLDSRRPPERPILSAN
jgi:hypothetical protein